VPKKLKGLTQNIHTLIRNLIEIVSLPLLVYDKTKKKLKKMNSGHGKIDVYETVPHILRNN